MTGSHEGSYFVGKQKSSPLIIAILAFSNLIGSFANAEDEEGRIVFGLAAQLTLWDNEQHEKYKGDWSTIETSPTAGFGLLAGYRFNRYFELGLRTSINFPSRIGNTNGILVRALPEAKLLLPLPMFRLYGSLQAGYSYFHNAAAYAGANSHGAALGGSIGAEIPLFDGVCIFVDGEFLYQFNTIIPDDQGYFRYGNFNLTIGILF